jgi:nucleotide-binding universal stress UspA family protein
MKTLLLVINELDSSKGLLEYAIALSKDLRINIRIMYVENPAEYSLGTSGLSGASVAQTQHILDQKLKNGKEKLTEQVKALMPSIAGEIIVEVAAISGNENRLIREQIEAGRAQWVMIEEPESQGFWPGGTMAKEIVKDLSCPVWIIPKKAKYKSLNEIIYASDYQEEDIDTIKRLVEMTVPLTPQITALHFTDTVDFEERIKEAGFQKMLELRAGYSKIKVETLVDQDGDEMADLLNSYAIRKGADLMVVLKENRGFLERIFKPSSSEKIIEDSNLPVLVFHAN